jgi:hypothetical protein
MTPVKVVAIVAFIVSVVLAVMGSQLMNPLLWAVWAFAVLSVFS